MSHKRRAQQQAATRTPQGLTAPRPADLKARNQLPRNETNREPAATSPTPAASSARKRSRPAPLRLDAAPNHLIEAQYSRLRGSPKLVLLSSLKPHLHPKRQPPRRIHLHGMQAGRHTDSASAATPNGTTATRTPQPLTAPRPAHLKARNQLPRNEANREPAATRPTPAASSARKRSRPAPLRLAAAPNHLIEAHYSRLQGSPQLVLLPSLKPHLHPKRQPPRRIHLHGVQAGRHTDSASAATTNSTTRDLHGRTLRSARQDQRGTPCRRPATAQNRKKRDQKTQPRPIHSQDFTPQQRRPRQPRRP
jgi:hypothetical protein